MILSRICPDLVSGLVREQVQFAMLCEQNMRNVWRKNAFNQVLPLLLHY